MKKVFIDGSAGTTGLRIFERLSQRNDLLLMTLPEELRKDPAARKQALNSCDVAFLCLPDAAAIEAVSLIENDHVTVLDTSTAHRTDPEWAYGFPELGEEYRQKLLSSKRIAVPGCHASGFIALVAPLVQAVILPKQALLTSHSITVYSGGGKKMIAEYEAPDCDTLLKAPRQYGLTQQHKHLKEIKAVCGLDVAPVFCPIVSNFYSGMVMTVPVFSCQLAPGKTVADIKTIYEQMYCGPMVTYKEAMDEEGFLSGAGLSHKDVMEVCVCGNDERILLMARYDNLGKGASGAAVQCLNLVLGCDPTEGLEL